MTPSITVVRMSGARDREALPLLVLGPALGTSAATLWGECARGLGDVFDVVAWDLPGHGYNAAVPEEPIGVADLAAGVLDVVDDVLTQRGQPRGPFFYAGVSVGGAVGLQLLLDAPDRVVAAALLGTGPRLGTAESWAERVAAVQDAGTGALVESSAQRWFAPGFAEGEPDRAAALLRALSGARDAGYAAVCGALATFDVRTQLDRVRPPVLAVAGTADRVAPPDLLREVAAGVQDGRFVELPDVAHLAPVEAPTVVAALLREHFLGEDPDAEEAPADAETAQFARAADELVSTYRPGELPARPGLDGRTRVVVALAALIARGDHDGLAAHVGTALRSGLSAEELREVVLETALVCGVPAAVAAFTVASAVLREEGPG